MKPHVMVDLEALSTQHNAVIVAIGAVKFYPNKSGAENSFYLRVSADQEQFNRHFDGKTIEWWMDDARNSARRALVSTEAIDLPSALDGFSEWFGNESLPVWGNGATFDNVILRSAFDAIRMPVPWKYYDDRCFRTFKSLAPHIEKPVHLLPDNPDLVAHHALYDAHLQALQLQEIVQHLMIGDAL